MKQGRAGKENDISPHPRVVPTKSTIRITPSPGHVRSDQEDPGTKKGHTFLLLILMYGVNTHTPSMLKMMCSSTTLAQHQTDHDLDRSSGS